MVGTAPSIISVRRAWESLGKCAITLTDITSTSTLGVYTLYHWFCCDTIEGRRKTIAGLLWQTVRIRVFFRTLVTFFMAFANFVNVVNGRPIAQPQRIVAHLKAPTAIRPVLGNVGERLIIKADEFLKVFVAAQDIRLDALLKARIGENRAARAKSGLGRESALILYHH